MRCPFLCYSDIKEITCVYMSDGNCEDISVCPGNNDSFCGERIEDNIRKHTTVIKYSLIEALQKLKDGQRCSKTDKRGGFVSKNGSIIRMSDGGVFPFRLHHFSNNEPREWIISELTTVDKKRFNKFETR